MSFTEFYSQWYSEEVVNALKLPTRKCLRFHGHDSLGHDLTPIPWAPKAYYCDTQTIDPNSRDYYWMDPASLLPVLALDVHPGQRVGDFCAAPGGKTAFIADLMHYRGTLMANEFSTTRAQRLQKTLERFSLTDVREEWTLIREVGSARILDRQYADYFDRILLDVPCSSEAHVLQDPKELAKWTPARSALLAKRQRKLVVAAVNCLKSGGRLVYSTCSISPLENEENMKWFDSKMNGKLVCIEYKSPVGIGQRYGVQVLPHRDQMGPLYFSVWEKRK